MTTFIRTTLAMSLFLLFGCVNKPNMMDTSTARANFQSAAGQNVTGMAMVHQSGGSFELKVKLAGLEPGSVHGFHIHTNGDCRAADFSSAGGHLNPGNTQHGGQTAEHHAGDLPNLVADANGNVDASMMLSGVNLVVGDTNSMVGRALVIHASADDFQGQPAGNSGERIACGVIALMSSH
jgi:Cu-Zn family superoxide dismutase